MSAKIATIDFHITSECSQECPYCWGPMNFEHVVDTDTAKKIITKIKSVGARRIVFTGGDPLTRKDIGELIQHANSVKLEIAVSTTGDEITAKFLKKWGSLIQLISIPIDGSSEEINSRTKEKDHLKSVLHSLELLRKYPGIDVKLCTPVTRHNLSDIVNIASLTKEYSYSTKARVFYNIFQSFPRSMQKTDWDDLLVTDQEFRELESKIGKGHNIIINFLDHNILDQLYVMIFPDGSLVIPRGSEFYSYGRFLEINNLDEVLEISQFDSAKHILHSHKWKKLNRTLHD
jgi:MoaA/NifB/PqqE/SkfB family radical SAM enzyme